MLNSAEEFVRLRSSDDEAERWHAIHGTAPESVWWEVLHRYPEMTWAVIHNKTVPLSILRHLAKHTDPHVRSSVADKRKLDVPLFELLSRDSDETVRARIAWNRKTPKSVLERLANDPSPIVREPAQKRLEEN